MLVEILLNISRLDKRKEDVQKWQKLVNNSFKGLFSNLPQIKKNKNKKYFLVKFYGSG